MNKQDYLCIGKIVNTRGLNGELKVEPWCDYPEKFYEIKNIFLDVTESPLKILDMRVHKSNVLMKLENINSINEANKLCGKHLYAFKNDIPIEPDTYFIEDLKGCEVFDHNSGVFYGKLKDVFNTGANDIYSVVNETGREYLVPIINGTVNDINLEDNKIFISPLQGVFDD